MSQQEYYFNLEPKQLHTGIKRHNGDTVPALKDAYNLEVSKTGIFPYEPLTMLEELEPNWPFPWLGGEGDRLFSVSKEGVTTGSLESWQGTTSTHITDLSFPSFTMNDIPDIATFDTFRVITGTFGVMTGVGDGLESNSDIPRARTCCNYKGQLILGGILDPWYDCDETFIAYSNIGDVTMEPDWKNEAGYRPINHTGRIYRVRRLGDKVAVYGEKGIVFLTGVGSPAPTFGMKEVAKLNLASPAAADGGLNWHVVIDKEGYLWFISEKEGAQRIGYKDALSTLTLSDVVVSYDSSKDRIFISDGDKSFLMTKSGLTRIYQIPSGTGTYQSTGYFLGVEDTTDYLLEVGPFDFGYQGGKMLRTVESNTGESLSVGILMNNSFNTVKTLPFNDKGVCMPGVAGKSFMLTITGENYNVYPNHVMLRWKMNDLRGMRGFYQPRQS